MKINRENVSLLQQQAQAGRNRNAYLKTKLIAAFALFAFTSVCPIALGAAELTQGDREIQELLGPECPVIQLWPDGKGPDEVKAVAEETFRESKKKDTTLRLTNVTNPTITVARPKEGNNNKAAVLVCPGGGYGILAINKEGTEIIQWLNSIGVTGILLKYRVPKRNEGFGKHHHALQDTQRAMGIIRARASEWGIDREKIGICGFSAGGHLAAALTNNYQQRTYRPVDEYDKASCRPDFTILVYPAYLTDPIDSENLDPLMKVEKTPGNATTPVFISIAEQDKFTLGALLYYLELRRARVPSELHVFPAGGHGGGLRAASYPHSEWPRHCARWMKDLGLL